MTEKKPEGPRDASVANPPDAAAAEDETGEPKRTHGLGKKTSESEDS